MDLIEVTVKTDRNLKHYGSIIQFCQTKKLQHSSSSEIREKVRVTKDYFRKLLNIEILAAGWNIPKHGFNNPNNSKNDAMSPTKKPDKKLFASTICFWREMTYSAVFLIKNCKFCDRKHTISAEIKGKWLQVSFKRATKRSFLQLLMEINRPGVYEKIRLVKKARCCHTCADFEQETWFKNKESSLFHVKDLVLNNFSWTSSTIQLTASVKLKDHSLTLRRFCFSACRFNITKWIQTITKSDIIALFFEEHQGLIWQKIFFCSFPTYFL